MEINKMIKNTVHMDKLTIRTDKRAIPIIKFSFTGKLLIFALATLQLAGCVKDDLYNTPHPDKGAVRITTDWSGASSDAVLPQSYILRIGTEEQTVTGTSNAFNALFEPGRQDLLVCHGTDGITLSGHTATVNTLADGTLEPMPGYLFSGTKALEIVKDDTLRVTVNMEQRIRRLTLVLKLTPGDEDRISTTSATLTGIASAIALRDGTITATVGKTVASIFSIGTYSSDIRSAEAPALAATLRLLGVMPAEHQTLTLAITLTDGYVHTLTTDLTEALGNFNTGAGMEPLVLDATLELPTAGDFHGTISGWEQCNDLIIDAH